MIRSAGKDSLDLLVEEPLAEGALLTLVLTDNAELRWLLTCRAGRSEIGGSARYFYVALVAIEAAKQLPATDMRIAPSEAGAAENRPTHEGAGWLDFGPMFGRLAT